MMRYVNMMSLYSWDSHLIKQNLHKTIILSYFMVG